MYAGRRSRSLMPAIIGAIARIASTRPSRVAKSYLARVESIANSNSGRREAIRERTAASPLCRRRSQGSMPFSATATKVCATKRWSSWKAAMAAFWPAASPSKVKMISPPEPSSVIMRRTILMWPGPNAVPQVATAVVMPARYAAMTSV